MYVCYGSAGSSAGTTTCSTRTSSSPSWCDACAVCRTRHACVTRRMQRERLHCSMLLFCVDRASGVHASTPSTSGGSTAPAVSTCAAGATPQCISWQRRLRARTVAVSSSYSGWSKAYGRCPHAPDLTVGSDAMPRHAKRARTTAHAHAVVRTHTPQSHATRTSATVLGMALAPGLY